MYEEKLIESESLGNVTVGEEVTGFQFDFRLPADRGMWLSLVGGIYLAVDGQVFPESAMTLILEGVRYPVSDLAAQTDVHWGACRPARLEVDFPGGLAHGTHEVDFQVVLLGGYFKAKEEWVTDPPKPGPKGAHRFTLACG